MGGSISMLRADIKAHVKIAFDYPNLLEPHLSVCEEGEGITPKDRDNPEFLDRIKEFETDVSTEVELVAENEDAINILLAAVETYATMVPAPEFDTKKRTRYFARFRTPEPFPDFYDPVGSVDLERYRVSLLRMSLRCLRMITVIDDVRKYVMGSSAIAALNRVVDENPLDTFIRKDVKAIFKSTEVLSTEVLNTYYSLDVFGGDQSVKRLENASVAIAVEVITDFSDSDVVQFSRVRNIEYIETLAKVIGQHGGVQAAIKLLKTCRGFYTNLAPTPSETSSATKLTDWTTPDLAQQALWALDVLSITDFNRITMKREKFKFVLSEVILGSKLIVPRRLRLLNWKDIGYDNDDDQHG
ncbi:hypothetical protein B5M09_009145 [Aphanomyces astaci]|uniref:Uncharacterized protein n=1 Tax=Aphanomyces astaci TaxID=112090 RepID=A0A425CYG4_APHAT|nr:hypothetical protein B5M09_009145 [Aphanomyces astaci]